MLFLVLTMFVPLSRVLADEGGQAGLVVQTGEGQYETRCVAFEENEIRGSELLTRSGLDVIVDPASGMGLIVCRIEGVGCAFPAEPCFCQCAGGGECIYWNYFYRNPGEEWTYSALGAALHKVKAGSVDAWVWGDGHAPPSSDLNFEAICVPPTPVPTETLQLPTVVPPTATVVPGVTPEPMPSATDLPTPTARPTDPPTVSQPTATVPLPSATRDASNSQSPLGYAFFGLMVLGLAAVGTIVWFRRR
jgi:hypothetical protein